MSRKKSRAIGRRVLAVGAAVAVGQTAEAATFNVTNTNDSGAGSLRQAIESANTNPGADSIVFDAAVTGTITLTSGQLEINDALDVQGPGSSTLSVSGDGASRIFYIYRADVAPMDVTISGLSLVDGFSVVAGDPLGSGGGAIRVVGENLTVHRITIDGAIAAGDGGGIAFFAVEDLSSYAPLAASLNVSESIVSNNSAEYEDPGVPISQGGCGGGIFASGGPVTIHVEADVIGNTATCNGGGIAVLNVEPDSNVTIDNSIITGNSVTGEAAAGGVFLYGSNYGETATITESTISANEALLGAGIAMLTFDSVNIVRSTISGNTGDAGGGIAALHSNVTLENSTVAQNAATYGGGILTYYSNVAVEHTTISGNTSDGPGPGIYAYYGSTAITSSIVANSIGYGDQDVWGDGFTVAHSLIESPGTAGITDNGGNLFDVDPQLGPLQQIGGPTATMRPALASPVVNAGDPAFVAPPATDQRGFARVAGGRIDMGAVELNAGTVQFITAASNVAENAGTATVFAIRTGGIDHAASVQVAVDGASTASGGGADYTFGGATLNFGDNDVGPKSFNVTITDDALPEAAETIVLTLSAPTNAAIGAPATHTVTIDSEDIASADLSVTKVLQPGPVVQGGDATFTISVTNNGPSAASNVVVTDTLPAQLTLVSAAPSTGSCSGTTTITCSLGTLDVSSTETITIIATMSGSGAVTNTASATSNTADANAANDSGQATFTILAASEVNIPFLDPRMQMLLAAILAAVAVGVIRK